MATGKRSQSMKRRWSNPKWRKRMVQVVRRNGQKSPHSPFDKAVMVHRLRKRNQQVGPSGP